MTIYLDCAATTPIDPRVRDAMWPYLDEEFGNAGSRTHEFGAHAKKAAEHAREQVADLAGCHTDEVLFTSGATESNNLALLGLADYGDAEHRRHLVSTRIEHKSVLEPLKLLAKRGFEVTLVAPQPGGWVDPDEVAAAVRDDTLAVSVMLVNNETGVINPIEAIADRLEDKKAFFHIDAAQGFGKLEKPLRHPRLDLISVSGHKVFGPKGVGALVARKRGNERPPLRPLMVGGGQEWGLRPGTLPVHQVVGIGAAAEEAKKNLPARRAACLAFRKQLLDTLDPLHPTLIGDLERTLYNTLSLRFTCLHNSVAMKALEDVVAVSASSACTSGNTSPSHVLTAMGLGAERAAEVLRFSWCHLTPSPHWDELASALHSVL